MDLSPLLEGYFRELQSELGSPFDLWGIVARPDYCHDGGYPAACYWLSDDAGKHYAFSFALRPDQVTYDYIKDELRGKLLGLKGS